MAKHDLTNEQQDRIRQWVEALRSGEYEQGQKALRNKHDNYCCLGVACDLYDSACWKDIGISEKKFSFLGQQDYLPEKVQEFLGLHSPSPLLSKETLKRAGLSFDVSPLSFLNDKGISFEIIADLIEEEFLND